MLPGPPVPISWRRVAARWHDRNLADVPATRRNGPGAETPGRRAGRERLRRRGRGPSTTRRRKALRKERHSSHTLRHTFATLWLDTKEPVKVLQEILGHFRIDVTMNIYAHVLPHIWEQAMDRFERRLQSVILRILLGAAPVTGKWSDKWSRRPCQLACKEKASQFADLLEARSAGLEPATF
jgi:integrase